VLISGPVALATPAGVTRIDVQTATDMLDACREQLRDKTDLFIGSAAVADYRPEIFEAQKIKKSGDSMSLKLVRNPDIISAVAMMTPRPEKVIGFAAETQDMLDHAEAKRLSKQLDAIVANDVSRSDIGFDSDANAVTWIDGEETVSIPVTTKQNLARILMERCALMLAHGKNESGQKQTGASG
ncbi:MAG: bifunctional 4'-phosphopantothenoylcysteine decarboxylase/phosphopantothenoylcysteine synthetase, partial [Luminiphilus sp.]|nr:bifunctional 4'-phosphopantothenoylcysteine decarboxylase/phosphopantothenoylcysteine synthetase [Luminiphilus sp.]